MYLLTSFTVKSSKRHVLPFAFQSLILVYFLSFLSQEPSSVSLIQEVLADGDAGTIDNGAYYSHVDSNYVYMNRTYTPNRCKYLKGEFWHTITVSNSRMDDKASESAYYRRWSWVGTDCEEEYGTWRWTAGPLAGINWYKGFGETGYAIHGRYVPWATPKTTKFKHWYPDDVRSQVYAFRISGHKERWHNYDFFKEYAIICERVYYKCLAKGTSKSDERNPKNIKCTCKKGFYSPLCDSVVVRVENILYAFTAFCGVDRMWDEARRYLKYKGRDWSAPNISVLLEKGVKELVGDKTAWLPAQYDAGVKQWRWTAEAGDLLRNTEVKLSGLPQTGQGGDGLAIDKGAFVSSPFDNLKTCVVWQEIQHLPDLTTTSAP